MGVLRLILSMAVLAGHSGPLFGSSLIPAPLAVETFYTISGFYMSMILGSKYQLDRKGITRFYLSRFFRLAPAYWIVLVLSILTAVALKSTFYLPARTYFNTLSSLSFPAAFWIVFTNVLMLGQDTIMFMKIDSSHLHFTADFTNAPLSAHKLLFIPQAWSLGVELWFYLLAPLLVRRKTISLIAVLVVSTIIRAILYSGGFDHDPWTYRFFPTELALFVLGMLMFRAYSRHQDMIKAWWGTGAFLLIITIIIFFSHLNLEQSAKSSLFLLISALSIPVIFNWSRFNTFDRIIGELSYPLYISHLLVVQVITAVLPSVFGKHPGLSVCAFSLGVSVLIYFFIDRPADRIRHRLAKP
jgi:peptidoglycan/LPS O-acetylase OafA/YrhL